MKNFRDYWSFLTIRGAMTILACVAIWVFPRAAFFIQWSPVLAALAVNCLAIYSVFDGGVMVLLNRLLPTRAGGRWALYVQAAIALITGSVLFLVACEVLSMKYVVWVVAGQAALAAVAEWFVARDTHRQYGCLSCYAISMVLACCAVGLPFAKGLDADQMSLALAGYVGLYGMSQFIVGGRMLFVEYRVEQPAPVTDETWRSSMGETPPAAVVSSTTTCAECAVRSICEDISLDGQVALLAKDRQSSIVRAVRITNLMKTI